MNDLISRQAAIDAVKRLHDVAWANWKETRISANAMVDELKDLPTAQPEPQWIPCSERLPERCQYYIVTDFGTVGESYYDYNGRWFTESGNKLKDVTAWMPIPTPYQENADA